MEGVNEIKIPQGVESISVKQHDDKIVIEFIPEEAKNGDLAIFWDNDKDDAIIRFYGRKYSDVHYDISDIPWENAIKFESKEQFEKFLRSEI